MNKTVFDIDVYSDIGGRRANEDAADYFVTQEGLIAVVADGLGGQGDGEIASSTACQKLLECGRDGQEITTKDIHAAFSAANTAIREKQTNRFHMKTTSVYLYIYKNTAIWAHAGDTRLYHIYNGELCDYTLDHSLSQMAVWAGEITRDQIPMHPGQNKVFHVLGSESLEIEVHEEINLKAGRHAFLMCSDGVWENASDSEIVFDLSRSSTAKEWIEYLRERVSKCPKEKQDNNTAVAIIFEIEEETEVIADTVSIPEENVEVSEKEEKKGKTGLFALLGLVLILGIGWGIFAPFVSKNTDTVVSEEQIISITPVPQITETSKEEPEEVESVEVELVNEAAVEADPVVELEISPVIQMTPKVVNAYFNRDAFDKIFIDGILSRNTITDIIFTNEEMPASSETAFDISIGKDNTVVCWVQEGVLYISGQGMIVFPKDSKQMFEDFSALRSIDFGEKIDTSEVTDMWCMFRNCANLTDIHLEDWNVSNVTDMENMFFGCKNLSELDLSKWDVSNVTSMSSMFYQCDKLNRLNIGTWDTQNVSKMSNMFYECENLQNIDLSAWDTSKVKSMDSMFYNCYNMNEELQKSQIKIPEQASTENMFAKR